VSGKSNSKVNTQTRRKTDANKRSHEAKEVPVISSTVQGMGRAVRGWRVEQKGPPTTLRREGD